MCNISNNLIKGQTGVLDGALLGNCYISKVQREMEVNMVILYTFVYILSYYKYEKGNNGEYMLFGI